MGMMQELKEFAIKGNVIDLAVGVIIGGAFGKIVTSLVDDVMMPPIGLAMGGMHFKELAFKLKDASPDGKVAAVSIKYGAFIQTTIDFALLAFIVFLMVKAINSLKKQEIAAPVATPEPSTQEKLLMEIRDALKK